MQQSDMEKLEGLPVAPFMDRDKVTKPSSQIGFIKFVLLPLFEAVGELFPQIDVSLHFFISFFCWWGIAWEYGCIQLTYIFRLHIWHLLYYSHSVKYLSPIFCFSVHSSRWVSMYVWREAHMKKLFSFVL